MFISYDWLSYVFINYFYMILNNNLITLVLIYMLVGVTMNMNFVPKMQKSEEGEDRYGSYIFNTNFESNKQIALNESGHFKKSSTKLSKSTLSS